ncbi:uncharacterized protein N7479_010506 [Penicillium vulpinum]|uniref:uncharacterized protein n=1 Tax=Penicillium vulpinum TaxID=29845 RepID=UPI0025471308|nr:uncharacterized protein N7479_010506 [Penicillium vulpinum]KAJ5952093.1 hypothetical protein N7479_010506 [Penicillium vulpinum]
MAKRNDKKEIDSSEIRTLVPEGTRLAGERLNHSAKLPLDERLPLDKNYIVFTETSSLILKQVETRTRLDWSRGARKVGY